MYADPGTPSITSQMVEVYRQERASVLAVQEVPREMTRQYGIVSTNPWNTSSDRITGIVEKPLPEKAPTNLAVVGRYILTPQIFEKLAKLGKGSGGEIQLTDGIEALLADQPAFAYRFKLGLKHPEIGAEFGAYLKQHQGS
jgi:UTP--glucose-1-phosphate uridylyltransferase